jgi:hypothetical protein
MMFTYLVSLILLVLVSGEAHAQIEPVWCTHATAQRLDADLNNDGQIDAVCHDRQTGMKWVAIRDGSRLFERWTDSTNNWCTHANASLFIGDVNGDGRADLICKDPGRIWVDYFGDDFYQGADFFVDTNWCTHSGATMSVSDQNFDGRADLVCENADGSVFVDLSDESGRFAGTDFFGTCTTRTASPPFTLVDIPRDGALARRTGNKRVNVSAVGAEDHSKQTFVGTTGFTNAPQMRVKVQAMPRVNGGRVRFVVLPGGGYAQSGVALKLVVTTTLGEELCSDEQILQKQEAAGLNADVALDRARTLSCKANVSGNYQARVFLRAWSTALLSASTSADADVTTSRFTLRECMSL